MSVMLQEFVVTMPHVLIHWVPSPAHAILDIQEMGFPVKVLIYKYYCEDIIMPNLFQILMSALLILATSMPHVLTPMAPAPVSAMVDFQEMDYCVKVMIGITMIWCTLWFHIVLTLTIMYRKVTHFFLRYK